MANRAGWMIYGANGYTGHLVAVEARRQGLYPVLAGRRAGPIETLAEDLGLPARVFDLGDVRAAAAALADMAGVGPFARPVSSPRTPVIHTRPLGRAPYPHITTALHQLVPAHRPPRSPRAPRSSGCGRCPPGPRSRGCCAGLPTVPPDPPRGSYAGGDPASGAGRAIGKESPARRGWRPPMATA